MSVAEALRLAAVLRRLDELGVDGFDRVRADLAAADRLEAAVEARAAAVEATEREMVDRLADGADLDDVAVELAGVDVHGLADVAERAVAECRTRATRSAAAEAFGAHTSLARVVDAAVADAVAAGGELVDVRDLAARLTPPRPPREGWSYGGSQRGSGPMHPWLTHPPVVVVDLDAAVAGDERRSVARARAVSATARVDRGLDVARMLEQVGGPASTLYGKGRDSDQVRLVGKLPTEVQLAVAAALGWEPRLRMTAPAAPRPDLEADGSAERARAAAVDAARRSGPIHRAIDRVVGAR